MSCLCRMTISSDFFVFNNTDCPSIYRQCNHFLSFQSRSGKVSLTALRLISSIGVARRLEYSMHAPLCADRGIPVRASTYTERLTYGTTVYRTSKRHSETIPVCFHRQRPYGCSAEQPQYQHFSSNPNSKTSYA